MKKLLLLVAFFTVGAIAETQSGHSTSGAPTSAPTSNQSVAPDKSKKLFEYVNACMVSRPASSDDLKSTLRY